ncbi:WXG100 family type VII secretion target, partial [Prauserella halophila]
MSLGMPENWDQVESRAAKVDKVDPGKIQSVAQEFKTASGNTGDHSADLKNAASPLSEGGVWNGPAAEAFFSYVEKVVSAGDRVKDKLDEAAGELNTLQQKLSDLKSSINETKAKAKKEIDNRNKEAEQQVQSASGGD